MKKILIIIGIIIILIFGGFKLYHLHKKENYYHCEISKRGDEFVTDCSNIKEFTSSSKYISSDSVKVMNLYQQKEVPVSAIVVCANEGNDQRICKFYKK